MSRIAAIGIDAGSTTCKLVAVDQNGAIVGSLLEPTEPRVEVQVRRLLEAIRVEHAVDETLPTMFSRAAFFISPDTAAS